MRFIKYGNLIYYWVLCLMLFSCSKENMDPELSKQEFNFDSRGGMDSLLIGNQENWEIEGVINQATNNTVLGDIYTLNDGKYTLNNGSSKTALHLNGLGKLVAQIGDESVLIERTAKNKLIIIFLQNHNFKDVKLSLLLKSVGWSKTISLNQQAADRYTITSIKYTCDKSKSDSIFNIGMRPATVVGKAGDKMILYPFSFNVYNMVSFESEDANAFNWVDNDSIPLVNVPHGYYKGNPYFLDGEQAKYNDHESRYEKYIDIDRNKQYEVILKKDTTTYYFSIEYKEITMDYALTIRNNRTRQLSVIHGTMKRKNPTGNFKYMEI